MAQGISLSITLWYDSWYIIMDSLYLYRVHSLARKLMIDMKISRYRWHTIPYHMSIWWYMLIIILNRKNMRILCSICPIILILPNSRRPTIQPYSSCRCRHACIYHDIWNDDSYADFVWARMVVITRIFGMTIKGNATDGLVPMADMLNHRRPGTV